VIASVDEGSDGEPAAGGLPRKDDVRWGRAVVQEGLVGCESVVDGGRIRVLGGEPVVDGEDSGASPPPDLRRQVSSEKGRGSIPSTVISAVGTPPNVAAVTVTSAGSGCAESNALSCRRCSSTSALAGKVPCRRIASRFSFCAVLTQDLSTLQSEYARHHPQARNSQDCHRTGDAASPDSGDWRERRTGESISQPTIVHALVPAAFAAVGSRFALLHIR